jgi:hypothetical protein
VTQYKGAGSLDVKAKGLNIVYDIDIRRLFLARHLIEIEDEMIPKKYSECGIPQQRISRKSKNK